MAAEASAAVKREIDRQIEEATPHRAYPQQGTAALSEAKRALVVAQNCIRRYRLALSFLVGLYVAESVLLAMEYLFIRKSVH